MEVTVVAPLRGRPGECDGVRDICHGLDDRFGNWELILIGNKRGHCDAVRAVTGNRVAVIEARTHGNALRRAVSASRGGVIVTCELDTLNDVDRESTADIVSQLHQALAVEDAPDVVLATGLGQRSSRTLGEHLVRVALRRRFRNPLTKYRGYQQACARSLVDACQSDELETAMLSDALQSRLQVQELLLREADGVSRRRPMEVRDLFSCVRLAMRWRPSFFVCAFGILTLLVGLVGVATLGIRNMGTMPPLSQTASFGIVTVAGMQIAGLSFLADKLSLRGLRTTSERARQPRVAEKVEG